VKLYKEILEFILATLVAALVVMNITQRRVIDRHQKSCNVKPRAKKISARTAQRLYTVKKISDLDLAIDP